MCLIRHSLKRKIFVIFLSVTLTLVIFGGILTIQGFQARIISDHRKQDLAQSELIADRISALLHASDESLNEIEASETMKNAFEAGPKNSLEIYSTLYEITTDIREFSVIDIYGDGECLYSTQSGYLTAALPKYFSVLPEASRSHGKNVYAHDPGGATESGSALLIAREIMSSNGTSDRTGSGISSGVAVIRIRQDILTEQLTGVLGNRDGFMLTDRFFRPFTLVGPAADTSVLAAIRKNLFAGDLYTKNMDNNVYITELGDTGLLGIYITPPALEPSAIRTSYQIIMIQVVISILLCLLVSSRLSALISKPIGTLAAAMRHFRKGDFDTRIELDREDEFGQLATGFNKMTSQLKKTMAEQVEAERKINNARIEMMQAQLNPHFLYNTLDTIKWVAKANQVPEVATMSASLAGILRTSISEKQFCTLEKELELVQNYCEIQKIRFDNKFDLVVDVPAEIRGAMIPKLILQPIVENAIIHGMEESLDGHIYVAAVRDTDKESGTDLLKISVQDDGKGISDEMMQALNNDDVETLKGHLGLNNVNTIIRLYYGKEYGVSAVRPSMGGTIMIVTLTYSEESPEVL